MTMRIQKSTGRHTAAAVVALAASMAIVSAQTKVTPPSNKYSVQEDIKLGQDAAREARQQLPLPRDETVHSYIARLGERLVAAIPADQRHPGFDYTFDVVNVRDINAFALPGGPMFVNRGMIEAAKTEGEVAGVMAHEISHVALRHGTAQASKATPYQIGQIAGGILGAIIGGTAGQVISQGTAFGLGTAFMKYGREYERQADIEGAQIMARAGYDPRDMANMFQTIEKQSGGGGPEWLSVRELQKKAREQRRDQGRLPPDLPVRKELVQRVKHQRDEDEPDRLADVVLERSHHRLAHPELTQKRKSTRRREREVSIERRICNEKQRRHDRYLNIEQLARDYPAVGIDVEDLGENTPQRSEQPRRKPDEPDDAVKTDRLPRLDDVDQNFPELLTSLARRKKPVDDVVYLGGRRFGGLVEEIAKARGEQQDKGDGREENIERNSPRKKKNVVFTAVVPDALCVIAQRPADPDVERPLRH
jgi:Zn-dependent protease with chaperone function